eukprot:g42331.t1
MNPCLVYERKRGVIYLFFICVKDGVTEEQQIWWGKNWARLCYVLSQDAGHSWTELTDLTDTVLGSQLCKWATFAVGPGHGLQTQQGRLIVPAYAYIICRRCCLIPPKYFTHPHSFYIFSDDSGDNWKLAEPITKYQALECELAEITITDSHHLLYCNARTRGHHRMEAVSLDPGHFEIVRLAKGLPESKAGCQGSWYGPWIIQAGPSGYSDLVYLDGMGTFACLYECGISKFWEQIAFCLFSISEIALGYDSTTAADGPQYLMDASFELLDLYESDPLAPHHKMEVSMTNECVVVPPTCTVMDRYICEEIGEDEI